MSEAFLPGLDPDPNAGLLLRASKAALAFALTSELLTGCGDHTSVVVHPIETVTATHTVTATPSVTPAPTTSAPQPTPETIPQAPDATQEVQSQANRDAARYAAQIFSLVCLPKANNPKITKEVDPIPQDKQNGPGVKVVVVYPVGSDTSEIDTATVRISKGKDTRVTAQNIGRVSFILWQRKFSNGQIVSTERMTRQPNKYWLIIGSTEGGILMPGTTQPDAASIPQITTGQLETYGDDSYTTFYRMSGEIRTA